MMNIKDKYINLIVCYLYNYCISYLKMNREELPRIRLKVVTNVGINILCTARRTWKVVEWLPHIQQAYREVKEQQQDDEGSKQRFIRAIRIKKQDFYIANSQYIGDIFEDNDEVQCQISFPQISKSNKKEKNKDKSHQKRDAPRQIQQIPIIEEVNEDIKLKNNVVEEEVEPKPKKKVKLDKTQKLEAQKKETQQQNAGQKTQKDKTVKENQLQDRIPENKKKNHKSLEDKQEKKQRQQQIMKSIDLAILKSKIKLPPQVSDINPLNGKALKVYSVHNDSDQSS